MAKIYTYSMILAAVTAIMTVGGVNTVGGFNILSLFGFNTNGTSQIFSSTFFVIFLGAIVVISAASIVASFFGRSTSESYVLTPVITGIFVYFVLDWMGIVNYIYTSYPDMTWLGNMLGIIFFVISVGFSVALIQFWRGNDI